MTKHKMNKTLATLLITSSLLSGCTSTEDSSIDIVSKIPKEDKTIEVIPISTVAQDSKETQVAPMSKAQALAIDAKHYARAYEVSHVEAMRRMLVMNDAQEQIDAIKKEFSDRLDDAGFTNEPEFALIVSLFGDGAPPDRIIYRNADKLENKPIILSAADKEMRAEGFAITQMDIDNAVSLIEKPTAIKVKFIDNSKSKPLTQEQKDNYEARSEELRKRIPMLVGMGYKEDEGLFVIDVHEDDSKKAGFTPEQLKKIGQEVMKSPVRIKFYDGYATEDVAPIE